MEHVPDAPWIRDAELNGYPADDPVHCPICGEECDTLFFDRNDDVFGCERCISRRDAYDWAEEQKEAYRDDS